MELLTPELAARLRANADAQRSASLAGGREPDPAPVVKFFNPLGGAAQGSSDAKHRWKGCGGAATWLATELDADGDTLFGLADLGFSCPELGSFSLPEIASLRLAFGLGIERDLGFRSAVPLSVWADTARRAGSIGDAARLLRPVEAHHRATAKTPGHPAEPDPDPLPSPDTGDG